MLGSNYLPADDKPHSSILEAKYAVPIVSDDALQLAPKVYKLHAGKPERRCDQVNDKLQVDRTIGPGEREDRLRLRFYSLVIEYKENRSEIRMARVAEKRVPPLHLSTLIRG